MFTRRGKYSIFTSPSKFESTINTKAIAAQAILEGNALREKLKDKIIFEIAEEEKDVEQNSKS